MTRHGSLTLLGLTLAAAGLLAANQQARPEGWPVIGVYGYWLVRIGIEATLFIAFLQLLSLLPRIAKHTLWAICLAALASYFPFVLSVTALDIVLGLPELDAPALGETGSAIRLGAFLHELVYLLDNHIILCALLSIPMVLQACWIPAQLQPLSGANSGSTEMPAAEPSGPAIKEPENTSTKTSFLESLSPPFTDRILRAEAQEHYVKLVGPNDTQMVLYRFSDILRELPENTGMQVHRSHWIAHEAIQQVQKEGNNTRLVLNDGTQIPVSRRYVSTVRAWAEQNLRQPSADGGFQIDK
ncbi:LytTR family DNA-binding domain-containing protein [Roseibium sp.]|uniref:LytTR family DNA-binding domain-containing protein n=1 Tax=Roseibium sp. TaxID=1936156 RepID=UPI003D0D61D9